MVVDSRAMFESTAMVIFLAETFGLHQLLAVRERGARRRAMGWTVWGTAQLGHDIHTLMMNSNERVPKEMHNDAAGEGRARGDREGSQGPRRARLAEHAFVMNAFTPWRTFCRRRRSSPPRSASVFFSPYRHIGAWMGRIQRPRGV